MVEQNNSQTRSQSNRKPLSPKQREALQAFATDGEAPDIADFGGPAGWHNRERVINALRRRGLINDDGTLTTDGLKLADCTCKHDTSNGAAHANECPVEMRFGR